jgi:type II secretory pathway component PulF
LNPVVRETATGESVFRYRAARASGVVEFGHVSARGREAASQVLSAQGLFPLELDREKAAGTPSRGRMPARDLATGLRLLATLLGAKISMGRTLAVFETLAPSSWKSVLPPLREGVRTGKGLASSLAAVAGAVPPEVLGLIRAGEASGQVAPAMRAAAELTERQAATSAAVRSALAYPILLAASGAIALVLLLGVVLPRFAAILADIGQELPPATALVLGVSDLLRAHAVMMGASLLFVTLSWYLWSRSEAGSIAWHGLLLRVPVIGTVRLSLATAKGFATLASLLESGVPISPALAHAARAAGDRAIETRMVEARGAVVAGARVSDAFRATGAATDAAVRLARAGEETGDLATMLAHAASIEGERAEMSVKNAVRMLEPALLLTFGGITGLVAAALLQAMYAMRPIA